MTGAALVAICALLPVVPFGQPAAKVANPPLAGLDRVPVVVRSLDQAVTNYRSLGFSIKPGCVHELALRSDGNVIELLALSTTQAERMSKLMAAIGAPQSRGVAGDATQAIFTLASCRIVVVDQAEQLVPKRPITRVDLRVRDAEALTGSTGKRPSLLPT